VVAGWDGTLHRQEAYSGRDVWHTPLTSPWSHRRDEHPTVGTPSTAMVEGDRLNWCAVSEDGRTCAAVSHSGRLFIVDAADGAIRSTARIYEAALYACEFAPGEDVVVCGGDGGRVALVSAANGAVLNVAAVQGSQIRAMGFDPSGQVLATLGANGSSPREPPAPPACSWGTVRGC
jgi:WD40 repeat protein